MGVSNYLQTKSERERVEQARRAEQRHIEQIPAGERREIREIFSQKGFDGEAVDGIVETITQDEAVWVETMVREELGLRLEGHRPVRSGLATFLAFLLMGAIPLAPFFIPGLELQSAFLVSAVVTGVGFLSVGLGKGLMLDRPLLRSGVETLLVGGGAAALAYLVGHWLRQAYGVAMQ